MKCAVYIEEGRSQIVLTPESEWEKRVIQEVESKRLAAHVKFGSFYDCQGGWVRQRNGESERSLIVMMEEE